MWHERLAKILGGVVFLFLCCLTIGCVAMAGISAKNGNSPGVIMFMIATMPCGFVTGALFVRLYLPQFADGFVDFLLAPKRWREKPAPLMGPVNALIKQQKYLAALNRVDQMLEESPEYPQLWLIRFDLFRNHLGLPGEAALAYVTGYFVNVYAAISVAASLELDVRAMTILSVMVLCSHNMITETAVQKKSGSSAVRIVLVRTFSAFFLAFVLNRFLPGEVIPAYGAEGEEALLLGPMLKEWAVSTLWLILKMGVLIYSLSIMQRLLAEFGVIRLISKFLKPLLALFGLPARTSLLWIVANILGLAYGAAIMIQESRSGKISRNDIDLLNTHISIAHSNFEDLFLLSSVGGIWYVLLLSRWLMAMVLVWLQRLEIFVADKIRR